MIVRQCAEFTGNFLILYFFAKFKNFVLKNKFIFLFRYGQKKPCQIYRFVTDYTLEKQIYDRQIHKGGMANRVVDEMNPDSHFNSKELLSTLLLEIRDLEKSQNTIIEHDVDNFSDNVIRSMLAKYGDKIT